MNYQDYDEIFERDNYPQFRKVENRDGWLRNVYTIFPHDYGKCLCMSGEKFKFCCKDDVISTYKKIVKNRRMVSREEIYGMKPKKLLSRKIENASVLKKNISYCFAKKCFDNCDTNNHNRKSHTMSEGNVFKNLSGEYVIGFDDHTMEDEMNEHNIRLFYKEVSVNDASATVSFCKVHDEYLFAEIEQTGNAIYKNTYIEDLEYALKASTYDIYYRIMRIKYMSSLFGEHIDCAGDRFMIDYKEDIDVLFDINEKANLLLQDIKVYKMSGSISAKFHSIAIKLPISKINYSLSECITYKGICCFINVVNIPVPYILISYYSDGAIKALEDLKDMFEKGLFQHIIEFLDLTLCTTQNVFFNKDAYNNLSDEAKCLLYRLHRNYEAISYLALNTQVVNELEKELFVI
jgi:hypothetical protein